MAIVRKDLNITPPLLELTPKKKIKTPPPQVDVPRQVKINHPIYL
jgi:hypothetical protein